LSAQALFSRADGILRLILPAYQNTAPPLRRFRLANKISNTSQNLLPLSYRELTTHFAILPSPVKKQQAGMRLPFTLRITTVTTRRF
jgi:hypothetical protein